MDATEYFSDDVYYCAEVDDDYALEALAAARESFDCEQDPYGFLSNEIADQMYGAALENAYADGAPSACVDYRVAELTSEAATADPSRYWRNGSTWTDISDFYKQGEATRGEMLKLTRWTVEAYMAAPDTPRHDDDPSYTQRDYQADLVAIMLEALAEVPEGSVSADALPSDLVTAVGHDKTREVFQYANELLDRQDRRWKAAEGKARILTISHHGHARAARSSASRTRGSRRTTAAGGKSPPGDPDGGEPPGLAAGRRTDLTDRQRTNRAVHIQDLTAGADE